MAAKNANHQRCDAEIGIQLFPVRPNLPYPKITSLADVRRAQRHVHDPITTLRHLVAQAFANKLPRCPCCGVFDRYDRI